MASEQLATERAKAEAMETFLVAQSTHLNKSLVENEKLLLYW